MVEQKLEDPLPPKRPMTVGVVYNLKSGKHGAAAVDDEAEYDSIDTVDAICAALREGGYSPVLLEAGRDLPAALARGGIDIAFNIAEGHGGRGREAQIPALLNLYDIPFTGSDETTLCVALDKALTKRIVSQEGVHCPASVLLTGRDAVACALRFPLIVKPNAEGSSKGISDVSIVETPQELAALAQRNCSVYHESMLAEEYIEGREFTVGLLGNGDSLRVFPPMEIRYRKPTQGDYHVYSYNVKQNYKEFVEYSCPARLTNEQTQEMTDAARRVFNALGCRDFGRVDFRMDADGAIYFIEINPLPGLAPGYSDYPMLVEFSGVPYGALVRGVLEAALRRLSEV